MASAVPRRPAPIIDTVGFDFPGRDAFAIWIIGGISFNHAIDERLRPVVKTANWVDFLGFSPMLDYNDGHSTKGPRQTK